MFNYAINNETAEVTRPLPFLTKNPNIGGIKVMAKSKISNVDNNCQAQDKPKKYNRKRTRNTVRFDGGTCSIFLSNGMVAKIDTDDYDKIKNSVWCFSERYVRARIDGSDNKQYLHRFLLGITDPKKRIDHIDHDTLNNKKENLRVCTPSQNNGNQKLNRDNTSGFKGVSFHKNIKKFSSHVRINGYLHHLGYFNNPVDAAKEYDKKAIGGFGSFAATNEKLGLI